MGKSITAERATIYLSARRGCTVRPGMQSWHTFNFGNYFSEHRTPFFNLCAFNDELLNAGTTTTYEITSDSHIILIPVVGGIYFQLAPDVTDFVEAEQVRKIGLRAGSLLKIRNPFSETVNYLVLQFALEESVPQLITEMFVIDCPEDSLKPIFTSPPGFIGKFSGRFEASFKPRKASSGVFAFVIEGAFEVQGRLLEARDALAITGAPKIDFEALSSGAILLLIDL